MISEFPQVLSKDLCSQILIFTIDFVRLVSRIYCFTSDFKIVIN